MIPKILAANCEDIATDSPRSQNARKNESRRSKAFEVGLSDFIATRAEHSDATELDGSFQRSRFGIRLQLCAEWRRLRTAKSRVDACWSSDRANWSGHPERALACARMVAAGPFASRRIVLSWSCLLRRTCLLPLLTAIPSAQHVTAATIHTIHTVNAMKAVNECF